MGIFPVEAWEFPPLHCWGSCLLRALGRARAGEPEGQDRTGRHQGAMSAVTARCEESVRIRSDPLSAAEGVKEHTADDRYSEGRTDLKGRHNDPGRQAGMGADRCR